MEVIAARCFLPAGMLLESKRSRLRTKSRARVGGSDTSAKILANALPADLCLINLRFYPTWSASLPFESWGQRAAKNRPSSQRVPEKI